MFFNEKEADYTELFTKFLVVGECVSVHYLWVIYLAKLNFDNRGTLGVGVAMGDNLNRFL